MPLICCTNVFFQGRLSRHITTPSEKTHPESWPGDYVGKATLFWQLSSSTAATKCNVQPSRATANPVGGKACSSTKGGLLRCIVNHYSIQFRVRNLHITSTQYAANMLHQYVAPTYFFKGGYPVTQIKRLNKMQSLACFPLD